MVRGGERWSKRRVGVEEEEEDVRDEGTYALSTVKNGSGSRVHGPGMFGAA